MAPTNLEKILDTVHNTSTAVANLTAKPPRKWIITRETVITGVKITSIIITAVASLLPGVKPLVIAAGVMNALGRVGEETTKSLDKPAATPTAVTVTVEET